MPGPSMQTLTASLGRVGFALEAASKYAYQRTISVTNLRKISTKTAPEIWTGPLSCLFVMLFTRLPLSVAGAEISFKAEGKVTYEIFSNNQLEHSSVTDFKVVVQGCRWLVESFNLEENFYVLRIYTNGLLNHVARARTNNPALPKYS